jgi:hypothetical protein
MENQGMSLRLIGWILPVILMSFKAPAADSLIIEMGKATQKLNSVSNTQHPSCGCLTDSSPLSLVDAICAKPADTSEERAASESEVKSIADQVKQNYFSMLSASTELDKDQKEALRQRLEKIPPIQIKFCDKGDINYDNLSNTFTGCFPQHSSPSQVAMILSHEYAHSIGPCAYHAGWSPSKWGFAGRTLKYSEPMNFQKSLIEYPLRKFLTCQPAEILNLQLANQVSDSRWNSMCAHLKAEEFFADALGFAIFNKLEIENPSSFKKNVQAFCPGKGKVGKITEVNGVATTTWVEGWMTDSTHPDFEARYALFYAASKAAKKQTDLGPSPSLDLSACYSGQK